VQYSIDCDTVPKKNRTLRAIFLYQKPENDAETSNKQTSMIDKKPRQDGSNGLHLYE